MLSWNISLWSFAQKLNFKWKGTFLQVYYLPNHSNSSRGSYLIFYISKYVATSGSYAKVYWVLLLSKKVFVKVIFKMMAMMPLMATYYFQGD